MSKYTIELRYILEQTCLDKGLKLEDLNYNQRCLNGKSRIFTFDYPIWLPQEKDKFEVDFCRHFYLREIGLETPEMFKIYLDDWLNTNMPYYNRLIQIQIADMDLNNFDYDEWMYQTENNDNDINKTDTDKRVIDTSYDDHKTDDNTSTSSSHSFQKYYEVPSNNISTIDDHLNNATQLDSNGEDSNTLNSDTNGNSNVNNDYTGNSKIKEKRERLNDIHTKKLGRQGITLAEIYKQYMDLAANVKAEIFKKMDVLFMGIY